MTCRSLTSRMLGCGATATLLALAPHAFAQDPPPLCTSLPNPVFVKGSSAVQPFLQGVAKVLAGAPTPLTVVYVRGGSCTGVEAIINGTSITENGQYWDTEGKLKDCTGQAVPAAVGVSDVFATSCQGVTDVPADVGDFFGPVQVMNFVVPAASSRSSISAEAAYLTFGLGQAGETSWNDENLLIVRDAGSGTQTMLGKAINVPPSRFKGVNAGGSGTVVSRVGNPTGDPEKTIGILASNEADANRATLKILAYQHYGQNCGYWPDSSLASKDKRNVRIGRYPVWGPLHLLTKVDSAKNPVNANAADLIGYLTGSKELPGADVVKVAIDNNTVPLCAMQVKRSEELGPVSAYTPDAPCGCYFDAQRGDNGPGAACQACTTDAQCTGSAKVCRRGYCEAK